MTRKLMLPVVALCLCTFVRADTWVFDKKLVTKPFEFGRSTIVLEIDGRKNNISSSLRASHGAIPLCTLFYSPTIFRTSVIESPLNATANMFSLEKLPRGKPLPDSGSRNVAIPRPWSL